MGERMDKAWLNEVNANLDHLNVLLWVCFVVEVIVVGMKLMHMAVNTMDPLYPPQKRSSSRRRESRSHKWGRSLKKTDSDKASGSKQESSKSRGDKSDKSKHAPHREKNGSRRSRPERGDKHQKPLQNQNHHYWRDQRKQDIRHR